MTFISYAQNGEDILLWRALGHVGAGRYIDVGAHHPDIDSVTRAFYDRGWSGVNVEPLAEPAAQIAAVRTRDVTLRLALGAADGELPFFEVPGTGLSTLDPAAAEAARAAGHAVRETTVTVRTLAEICRLHAAGEIHFLKIDVEGAERQVLEGADLEACRPWIILLEATAPLSRRAVHADWEPLLLAADYAFVWFDGLNRYYVSRERLPQLGPCFGTQPNVFDDFLRASDSGLVRRVDLAEAEGRTLRAALRAAEADVRAQAERGRASAERTVHEVARLREAVAALRQAEQEGRALQAAELAELRWRLLESSHELQHTHLRLQAALQAAQDAGRALGDTAQALELSREALARTHASRSWRLTAPLRGMRTRIAPPMPPAVPMPAAAPAVEAAAAQAVPETPAASGIDPAADADAETGADAPLPVLPPSPPAAIASASGALRAVHQFHSGSAVGDAITNAMLLTRTLLRGMGYRSEIYTERPPAALAHELLPLEAMPRHDGYVLILRHSMGYDRHPELLALPAPKVLLYHNITPTALLARHPYLARYAELGRAQLAACRGRVRAALADSDYNATELRRLGLAPVRTCTLLFDVDRLRARAAAARPAPADGERPFTVLFVGRINAAKGQRELVRAFAAFRARFDRPSLLVLVGRDDGEADPFLQALRRDIAALGPGAPVRLTGGIDDDALDRAYAAADLYVSLSRHEGFGVPLVEAMAHGVPVLALAGGAVPYTLAGAGRLLDDAAPDAVAEAMLALARDPAACAELRRRGTRRLADFALDRQRVVLGSALLRAGAALPDEPALAARLAANVRYTVTGHVNGSYSLAAINRDLALALEAARPGRVRLLPVEGTATADLSGVPAARADAVAALARRPPHATGPELVISQHYPVHVPPHGGDAAVALLFWEESLLPAATIATLNDRFRAVVAPTRAVREALLESGLRVPVRVIPPALRLEPFLALRRGRPGRDAAPAPVHRFLHVSSCFPRKGVDVLLAAWAAAFRAGDPVRLVIKGFPNPHNDVAARLRALRDADPELAPVELVDRDLGEAALLGLYADADTMVLPTRGEGYNLPAAEALAAGLRLIVTGQGGHLDFCADACGPVPGVRLLRCRAVPSGSHVAAPGSLWMEPDRDDLVAALRDAAAGTAGPPPAPPVLPAPDALADAYARLAADLLSEPPAPPGRIAWVSSWNLRCGISEYSRHLLGGLGEDPSRRRIRVLCDARTPAGPYAPEDRFWPCWHVGQERTLEPLAAAISADDPEAVVVQHQPGLLSFRTVAALALHPALRDRVLVATLHNTLDLADLPDDDRASVLAGLARFDRLLVHTAADLDRLGALGLRSGVTLLPHPVGRSRPARPSRPWRPDDVPGPLIGCHGFFLPGKGIDVLIEAVARLRARWPHLRLLLMNAAYDADESRDEIGRCRVLTERLGIANHVEFRTEFAEYGEALDRLAACDLLALPYRPSREAASGAVRGALDAGVPVAVTPIALFEELDDAVFRFDGIEATHIAHGLERLLGDAALRGTIGEAAQRWIVGRQWPDAARRMLGLVDGLIAARRYGD